MTTTNHKTTAPKTLYVRPSECDQCVVIETTTVGTSMTWTTEYAHETECPNSPRKDTKTHGK